jgi:enoyl-CoA hydratase
MTGGELLVEPDGPVLVLTINRPQARNAINHNVATLLAAALEAFDADPALAVAILTGAGGTFSAGMDLASYLAGEPREVEGRGFAGLTGAPPAKALIAAVEGFALAGGCEMVLACDLVVAARDAALGLPEVRRGLIAGAGGLIRLPRRIPVQIALEHALTGDPIPAPEAERWGLVNRLVEPGETLGAALELARRIAANAPQALRRTKDLIWRAHTMEERELWRYQGEQLTRIVNSQDAKEGAAAFLEKRQPTWRDA